MTRHVAAVTLAVCLCPSWLLAQNTQFTIRSASADVHKSPSTGSPVIGTASRGAVLTVTRELGSWVKISWPAAQDGIGYVHVNTGSIAHLSSPTSRPTARPAATSISARPAPEAPATTTGIQAGRPDVVRQPSAAGSVPIPHLVGLGGLMGGSTQGFGASVRVSVGHRLRVQLEASRYAHTSELAERLTSLQIAPSLLFSLPDKVTDYFWVRPYVGGGIGVYRSTLSTGIAAASDSVADNRLGRQVFGGAEVAFSSVPRFTLSADFGYRWPQTPFEGFELGGRGLSVSGHWYVK
jgi:Bacterial SH3 domain